MKDNLYRLLARFVALCIRRRVATVTLIGIATLVMGAFAMRVGIKTDLDDLLPKGHPYVKVNEQFKQGFGGSNMVAIMLQVEQGDIFRQPVLARVQKVTRDLQQVDGVNPFQIVSLASKKLKDIKGSTGGIDFIPLMWPDVPKSEAGLARLREAVLNSPIVYGTYVSRDLKAALVTVDFYDKGVDYDAAFRQIRKIADNAAGDGVSVHLTGAPILFGWVNHYLPETLHIFALTVGLLIALLLITARTWRGTLLPLLAGVVSAIWALGTASLLRFLVDPLVIVVAFLITARSISHSVQLVTRFDDEIAAGADSAQAAARAAMLALLKPGMLGVIADAGCMIVVLLTPIALMQKVAVIGTVWVLTIAVSAVVLTPVLLSWVRHPHKTAHRFDLSPLLRRVLDLCVYLVATRWRYGVLVTAAAVFAVSGLYAFHLQIGDANPGSPILWPDAPYNRDAQAINGRFGGADRMFVVFAGKAPGALKDPEVLRNIGQFQKFMSAQPEVAGSYSLADMFPVVQRTLREGNPRYQGMGRTAEENGELAFMMQSGSEPGDLARYTDADYRHGAITLFFHDHKGQTIRTAVERIKAFARAHGTERGEYLLAGGLVGVLAAVNEVLLSGQIESIALALLVLVVCCAVAYRSMVAGMFFMVPVLLSNTLTFSYMAFAGIGMNVNTVPVAALGIGLGVDYAFYIVDGIKEALHHGRGHGQGHSEDLMAAIRKSLHGAGRGVLVTATTLILSVVLWSTSSLRFQAEMGMLMAIWLAISAVCALFVMPAMVYVFRPRFIVGAALQASEEVVSAVARA